MMHSRLIVPYRHFKILQDARYALDAVAMAWSAAHASAPKWCPSGGAYAFSDVDVAKVKATMGHLWEAFMSPITATEKNKDYYSKIDLDSRTNFDQFGTTLATIYSFCLQSKFCRSTEAVNKLNEDIKNNIPSYKGYFHIMNTQYV